MAYVCNVSATEYVQLQGKAKNIFDLFKKNYRSSDKINILSVWLDFRETLPFAETA